MKEKYCLVLLLITLAALSLPAMVLAQTEPPSDPNAPWNPPPPSGTFAGHPKIAIIPGPGGGGGTILAYTTDYQLNRKDTFSGSESFYVVLVAPFSNYVILWWEYYPAGSVPGGHWIVGPWWSCCYSGSVAFSAMPESSEPVGQHVERFKVFDFASGKFGEALARWTYGQVPPNSVTTTTSLGSLPSNPTPGQSITISASVSPAPSGGTLTIQMSSAGGGWTTIQSGSAASGSLSVPWTVPAGSGTYTFQAVYSGYLDTSTTPNKQYQQSSSSPQTVTAQIIPCPLTLSASPASTAIDALTGGAGTISVTGTLSCQVAGASVILTYAGPSGTTLKPEVVGAGGIFTDSFTPTTPGTYTISAQFMGDQSHQGSQSNPTSVIVTTSWTNVIAIAVVVVAAVAVAAILALRRRSRRLPIQQPSSAQASGSLFCGKCGAANPPSNNFCRKCGTELTRET